MKWMTNGQTSASVCMCMRVCVYVYLVNVYTPTEKGRVTYHNMFDTVQYVTNFISVAIYLTMLP